jgi:hypothetical protein
MRTRHPFEDVPLEFEGLEMSMGDGGPDDPGPVTLALGAKLFATHPDAVEKGIELPLGFMPHRGENRKTRRAAVANFAHPEANRRDLLKQRQRQRRGKLDVKTRRLQRKATP